MTGRLIAIGDIHGCAREFEALLGQLELTKRDRVILLGDLVNRKPDSAKVIALAREHAKLALLGNHELRLRNYRKPGDPTHLKKNDYDTLKQLDHQDWAYLSSMPLTFHDPALGVVIVHGGFLPSIPWERQLARIVTRSQVVAKDGTPLKRAQDPAAPNGQSRRRGRPSSFTASPSGPRSRRLKWSLGIDTGCVMSGSLPACILPEIRIVQVRAREKYYEP